MSSVVASKLGMKAIMVVGDGEAEESMLKKWNENLMPNYTILRIGAGANSDWLRSRNELLKDLDGSKPMLQLCENGVCKLLDLSEVKALV